MCVLGVALCERRLVCGILDVGCLFAVALVVDFSRGPGLAWAREAMVQVVVQVEATEVVLVCASETA